jgi:hypothetical protein
MTDLEVVSTIIGNDTGTVTEMLDTALTSSELRHTGYLLFLEHLRAIKRGCGILNEEFDQLFVTSGQALDFSLAVDVSTHHNFLRALSVDIVNHFQRHVVSHFWKSDIDRLEGRPFTGGRVVRS